MKYRAFYAGPFAPEYRWLRHAVADATRSLPVELRIVDEVVLPGADIVSAIHREIAAADLAIVVLTDLRPNVLYELGRLQGSGIPTILVSPKSEPLPFDISGLATIFYDPPRHGELELSAFIGTAIQRLLTLLTLEGRERELHQPRPTPTKSGESTVLQFAPFDFEGIRRSVERQLGQADCHTIEIITVDSVTFKGWQQRLRCPMGDIILVVVDLNGQVIRIRVE
jgi:hypothetical protein